MRTLLPIVGVLLIGCASGSHASDQPERRSAVSPHGRTLSQSSNSASAFLVIGHIEKRDRIITIQSGPKGPVYTVRTAKGEVLFEKATESELRAKAPDIHNFIKTATASKPAATDASLRMGTR